MKKLLPLVALLVVVAAAAAAARWWRADAPEWTTDSPTALAELEAGEQAMQKLYYDDGVAHFDRALEHDADFLAPKVRIVQLGNMAGIERERLAALLDEVRAADLDRVTPRERLLARWVLARVDRDGETARSLVEEFLADHPDDPYALDLACNAAFARSEVEEAERCFERLIELDPNRVQAQNFLGYLAMARGDFAAAEERFEIYRYVAPDQANPHDSLGELYLLTGRYDEAERQFERAVAVKGDFCASWQNLVLVELLAGDPTAAAARAAEARQAGGCPEPGLLALDCRVDLWGSAAGGRWQEVVARGGDCRQMAGDLLVISHWAAWQAGDEETAAAIVEQVRGYGEDPMVRTAVAHLEAVGLLHRGRPDAAVERFRAADREIHYQSQDWLFKMFNRQALAVALDAAGRAEEAAALRAEIAAVNPRLSGGGLPMGGVPAAR
ncbi:MAG TPA: tetratricopeptide repeat protein [Thermoanaerobaculia bacterium]|nr:tetratricopeptide repeat protein [Thermoanaerobaculia bacterium]